MKSLHRALACVGLAFILTAFTGCDANVKAAGDEQKILATEIGDATFYASSFQGSKTAGGEIFDNRKPIAAHRSYPFGTVARVTNLENGKSVNVVIIDRGPYGKNRREGAIIDLSRAAAARLGMIHDGQVRVRVDVLRWGAR